MNARNVGFACWAALIALHTLWLTWWAPPTNGAIGIALALTLIPLLLPLLVLRGQPARAVLWVGILCLFYFCHGIAAAWGEPRARVPAVLEIVLCVALIGALGWGARGYRRKR